MRSHHSVYDLSFTIDGKMMADIGKTLAAELFGINLERGGAPGVDGIAPNRQSVQVKATGAGIGPQFRNIETHAYCLICLELDLARRIGKIVFNGPERPIRQHLGADFPGQRGLTLGQMRDMDKKVAESDRLPLTPAGKRLLIPQEA